MIQLEYTYKHPKTGVWGQCNLAAIHHMKDVLGFKGLTYTKN